MPPGDLEGPGDAKGGGGGNIVALPAPSLGEILRNRTPGEAWEALPARYRMVTAIGASFIICNMDKVSN